MPPPLEPASSVLKAMLRMWNHRLRQATLDDAHKWQRHYISIIRGDTLSAEEIARGDLAGNIVDELPPTPFEKARLLLFLRSSSYPDVKVCSRRYVATAFDVTNADAGTILIHGRIARALEDAPRSVGVAFVVVVNMVHELAHAVRAYFHGGSPSQACLEDESRVPFYAEVGYEGPPGGRVLSWFPEAGFSLEKKVFGGVVGVVFEGENEGVRPGFFECDYERIAYFFLITGDGGVYRLGEHFIDVCYRKMVLINELWQIWTLSSDGLTVAHSRHSISRC